MGSFTVTQLQILDALAQIAAGCATVATLGLLFQRLQTASKSTTPSTVVWLIFLGIAAFCLGTGTISALEWAWPH